MEVAENLRHTGINVTLVELGSQLMSPFDSDMASFIHAEMRRHGVKLALGYSAEGFAVLSFYLRIRIAKIHPFIGISKFILL